MKSVFLTMAAVAAVGATRGRRGSRATSTAKAKQLIPKIRRKLTVDLLKPAWRKRNRSHKMAGHCYVAAEALWHLTGRKLRVMRADCPGRMDCTHWWLETADGTVLDPTYDQFPKRFDYRKGVATGFLTKAPSKRAKTLIGRVRGKKGSRATNEYTDLEHYTGHYGPGSARDALAQHYPDTAAGTLEIFRGHRVFWAGNLGFAGPTDGRMVPIEARYLQIIYGNIFDGEKIAALVRMAKREPIVVHPGYAHLTLVDRQSVEESVDYANDDHGEPYELDDIGALAAQVRDGNHRTFAAVLAGADFAWVLMSDHDMQEINANRDSRHNRLLKAIRAAQKAHGAPQYTRPRRRKVRRTSELDAIDAKVESLTSDLRKLAVMLLTEFAGTEADSYKGRPLDERLQRPELYWRLMRKDLAQHHGRDWMWDLYETDPVAITHRELGSELTTARKLQWELREAAGIDPRTGEAATMGRR